MILFVSQHLMKGFANGMVEAAMPYVYRAQKVSGPRQQIYSGIAMLPWAMKPIIGLMSDNFPLFGYHKAPYLVVAAILGIAALFFLGLCRLETTSTHVVVSCFFTIMLCLSTTDLLTEAKYAGKIRENSARGPDLLT